MDHVSGTDAKWRHDSVTDVALAVAEHRCVDCDHERLETGDCGSVDEDLCFAAPTCRIELEPHLRAMSRRRHLLEWGAGDGAQHRDRPACSCRAGGTGSTVWVHQADEATWCEHHGHP